MKAEDPSSPAGNRPIGSGRSALDWPGDTGRAQDFLAAIALRQRRRRRRLQGAGALLTALCIGGFAWRWSAPPAATPVAMTAARTFVTLPARQVLPDGSVVELKDDAEIAIEFTAGTRRVVLRRGEAHFQVAKNAARPFVVDAGGIDVRAVGTAFTVLHAARAIEVFVTEGRVAVEEKPTAAPAESTFEAASPRTLAMLEAGKGMVVEVAAASSVPSVPQTRLFEVTAPQMDERLAWRAPRLDLSNTPLAQAIPMINRHSATQLVLGDEELGRVELSGVLRADNVEPLLRMLENNYAIRAERSPGRIVLHKAR